jgi:hypothetical protein
VEKRDPYLTVLYIRQRQKALVHGADANRLRSDPVGQDKLQVDCRCIRDEDWQEG